MTEIVKKRLRARRVLAASVAALVTVGAAADGAAEEAESVTDRITRLEQQLMQIQAELEQAKQAAAEAKAEAQAAREAGAPEPGYAADDTLSKWHLAGYSDATFAVDDREDPDTVFVAGKFNPVLHYQYDDFLLFEGELEFEVDSEGETETALEYAAIDIFAHDYATIVAGKFLSPIGQFQERLHPSWINKLPTRPVGFGHGGIQPLSEIGVQVRGGVPIDSVIGNYALFVGNGPRLGAHGPELEGFADEDNQNKAYGGRIGVLPLPYLEVGASYMTADIKGEEAVSGGVSEGDFILWGVDAAFTMGPWDVRGEYLNAKLGSFMGAAEHDAETTEIIPRTDWNAWYVQAAYQLSGLTDVPVLRNLEPVVRYGQFNAKGFGEFVEGAAPERNWSVGLNYLLSPSAMVKAALAWHDFRDPDAADDTEFRLQLAYGF